MSGRGSRRPRDHDAERLNARYRAASRPEAPLLADDADRQAYERARFAATRAANLFALRQLADAVPDLAPRSLLDLGAGSGAASDAAVTVFPTLTHVVQIDRDRSFMDLGADRARRDGPALLALAERRVATLAKAPLPEADLVIASYVVNEIEAPEAFIDRAWRAARLAFVITEAGSRRGAALIASARSRLLGGGATLAAPCPHDGRCPVSGSDWCHFSTAFDAAGNAADEKCAFVAALRPPIVPLRPGARILRAPMRRSGHVVLDLCSHRASEAGAPERLVVPKRAGLAYRAARAAAWGDAWRDRWPPPDGEDC